MNNEIKDTDLSGTIVDDNTTITTTGDSNIIDISDAHTIIPATNPYPYISPYNHIEEIAELRKEIKALKDMIAEHILLGH